MLGPGQPTFMRIALLFVGTLLALLAAEVAARWLWELRPPATVAAQATGLSL